MGTSTIVYAPDPNREVDGVVAGPIAAVAPEEIGLDRVVRIRGRYLADAPLFRLLHNLRISSRGKTDVTGVVALLCRVWLPNAWVMFIIPPYLSTQIPKMSLFPPKI